MLSFSLISLIYFIYFSPPSFSPISLSFSLSLSLPLLPFLTLRPSYPVSLSPSLALPLSISLVPPSPASLPILPFHPPPLSLSLSVCFPILAILLPLSLSLSRPSSSPPSLYLLPLPFREQAVFALWKRPLLPPPPTLSTLLSISSCSHLSLCLSFSLLGCRFKKSYGGSYHSKFCWEQQTVLWRHFFCRQSQHCLLLSNIVFVPLLPPLSLSLSLSFPSFLVSLLFHFLPFRNSASKLKTVKKVN